MHVHTSPLLTALRLFVLFFVASRHSEISHKYTSTESNSIYQHMSDREFADANINVLCWNGLIGQAFVHPVKSWSSLFCTVLPPNAMKKKKPYARQRYDTRPLKPPTCAACTPTNTRYARPCQNGRCCSSSTVPSLHTTRRGKKRKINLIKY